MALVPYAAGALATVAPESFALVSAGGALRFFGFSTLALTTQGGALTAAGAAGNQLKSYPVQYNNQVSNREGPSRKREPADQRTPDKRQKTKQKENISPAKEQPEIVIPGNGRTYKGSSVQKNNKKASRRFDYR